LKAKEVVAKNYNSKRYVTKRRKNQNNKEGGHEPKPSRD